MGKSTAPRSHMNPMWCYEFPALETSVSRFHVTVVDRHLKVICGFLRRPSGFDVLLPTSIGEPL